MSGTERLEVLMALHASDRAPWLRAALGSLAAQTHPADSVHIVEDGPVGAELRAELDAFVDRLPLTLHVLPESRGLGAALVHGLEATDAPLVARMDADDIAVPRRFEAQLAAFGAMPELSVVGSDAMIVDETGAEQGIRHMPVSEDAVRRNVWTNPFVHSAVMFRRADIERVGGYDATLRTRQDYDLWFRCAAAGLRMRNLPEPLVRYRVTARGKHRDLGVVWRQARIGWRGCRRVRAPLHAWIGVSAPLALALLPEAFGRWARRTLKSRS